MPTVSSSSSIIDHKIIFSLTIFFCSIDLVAVKIGSVVFLILVFSRDPNPTKDLRSYFNRDPKIMTIYMVILYK